MKIVSSDIDRQEILRYLSIPTGIKVESINQLVEQSIAELMAVIRPRETFQEFEILTVEQGILLEGTQLVLTGESIKKHLENAQQIIVMAVTLGIEAELLIKKYSHNQLSKMLVLDATATEIIEKYCDKVEEEILNSYKRQGYYNNFRFSPGYGDLPIELQPQILNLLGTVKKIGLTCNENNIMIPRKSVTAIIGLFRTPPQEYISSSCDICAIKETCIRRKEGNICGNK